MAPELEGSQESIKRGAVRRPDEDRHRERSSAGGRAISEKSIFNWSIFFGTVLIIIGASFLITDDVITAILVAVVFILAIPGMNIAVDGPFSPFHKRTEKETTK